jgi:hypothetical protein
MRAASMKCFALLALSLSLLAPRTSHAAVDWEDPKWDWSQQDTWFKERCKELNTAYFPSAPIPCSIDHASFDSALAREAKKPKMADRREIAPEPYCNYTMGKIYSGDQSPGGEMNQQCKKCKAELQQKVKSIVCRFDPQKNAKLRVTLDPGGVLTIHIASDTEEFADFSWLVSSWEQVFPIYKAWMAQF